MSIRLGEGELKMAKIKSYQLYISENLIGEPENDTEYVVLANGWGNKEDAEWITKTLESLYKRDILPIVVIFVPHNWHEKVK